MQNTWIYTEFGIFYLWMEPQLYESIRNETVFN